MRHKEKENARERERERDPRPTSIKHNEAWRSSTRDSFLPRVCARHVEAPTRPRVTDRQTDRRLE